MLFFLSCQIKRRPSEALPELLRPVSPITSYESSQLQGSPSGLASLESGFSHLEVDDWDFWQWRTLGGGTCRIPTGISLSKQDEICFCIGPDVNNSNVILKGICCSQTEVKSQQPSCLFLMCLARFGSLHTHRRCTALTASLSLLLTKHTHTLTCLQILVTHGAKTRLDSSIPHAEVSRGRSRIYL